MLAAEARVLARQLPRIAPMSPEAFVDHYSGRRKARYQQAVESLRAKPLDPQRESYINAFVKAEKYSPDAKVNPDPRMIQARNARYNVSVGVYLKPIEHHLYRLRDPNSGLPLIGKGLNHQERGRVLHAKWLRFRRPVCVSIDASRFDQHVALEVLQVEHSVYLRCNNDVEFRDLLKQQLNNRCFTRSGWKYKVRGSRMSGDMNTALGNCVLMLLMVYATMHGLNIPTFEVFDDGDDCLIIVEEDDLQTLLLGIGPMMLEFGQEIKVENIARTMEAIEWCQCRPVLGLDGEYQMVANWKKTLSHACAGTHNWEGPQAIDMAFSVGQCIMAVYPGMPILSKFAQRLCSSGKLHKDAINSDWMFKMARTAGERALGSLTTIDPSIDVRTSFYRAFGVDEIEQLRIEQSISAWAPCQGTPLVCGDVQSGDRWEFNYPPGVAPTERDIVPKA